MWWTHSRKFDKYQDIAKVKHAEGNLMGELDEENENLVACPGAILRAVAKVLIER